MDDSAIAHALAHHVLAENVSDGRNLLEHVNQEDTAWWDISLLSRTLCAWPWNEMQALSNEAAGPCATQEAGTRTCPTLRRGMWLTSQRMWSYAESNRRPSRCERDALPTEL